MRTTSLTVALSLLASIADLRAADVVTNLPPGVVAIVNDRTIREADVSLLMMPQTDRLNRQYKANPSALQKELFKARHDALEELIDRALILDEADQLGLGVKPQDLRREVEERICTRYGDPKAFAASLKAAGTTEEAYRKSLEEQMIVEGRKQLKSREVVPPTLQQIQRYYESNQIQFRVEDQVKLRMITLANQPSASRQAEEILVKLKAGESFTELAKTYSQSANRERGGDLGWVEKSVLRAELAVVAFELKPGEHSGLITTPQASFLLLVEDERVAHVKPLTEVSEDIRKKLAAQQQQDVVRVWLDKLRTDAVVLRASSLP
jgi:parvulin-like peptidyl-prolyl isomerase